MVLYNYSPNLPRPFCWVHPIKVKEIMSISQSEFPAEVQSFLLFGGALDPSCDGYSDIDLYAIIDEEDKFDDLNKSLRDIIRQHTKKYDLLISTADDFKAESNVVGTVEHEICNQGVSIYAKEKSIIA